jgi:hypothetical protein
MNQIINSIEKKDDVLFKNLLNSLPLLKMGYEESTSLLIQLLKLIEKNNFIEGLKYTLRMWGGLECGFDDYEGDLYPIIPTLFLEESIPFYILHYIMDSLRDVVSVEEVAIDLFEKGKGDKLCTALKNLFDMVGQPSGYTFRILTEEAMNSGNEIAIDFLSGLQSYYTDKTQVPKYMIEGEEIFYEKDLLELANDISQEIYDMNIFSEDKLNRDACIDMMIKGLTMYGLEVMDMEGTKKILYDKVSNMNEEQLLDYMKYLFRDEYRKYFMEDMSLFNIMGPVHPRMEVELDLCQKFGGCRMLYCNCFEYHIFDPDSKSEKLLHGHEWFKGKCDKCSRGIEKRCHAVRKPLPEGGWMGTFCSWNCLYLSGNVEDDLISRFEKEVNEKKILDREEINK